MRINILLVTIMFITLAGAAPRIAATPREGAPHTTGNVRRAAYGAESLANRYARARAASELPKWPTGKCVKGPCHEGMCHVPAGEFTMGCAAGDTQCDAAANPPKKVVLAAFCIDEDEVTQAEYEAVAGANPSHFAGCGGRCPVEGVTWEEADYYCSREGLRLPSSAEWEKAARGTDARPLPWAIKPAKKADICQYGVVYGAGGGPELGCGRNSTWETGSRPPGASPFGLLDIEGNVSEWVSDCADDAPYSEDAFGQTPVCGRRIARGSNWATPQNEVHVTNSIKLDPSATSIWRADLGFRCASDI